MLDRDEDQTNNRGELRAVHYALLRQPAGKPLHRVVDSEWVYKGVTEWGAVWRRHQWRTATGDVAHRDLWEPSLDLVQKRGDLFSILWVPPTLTSWVVKGQTSWQRKGGSGIGPILVNGCGRYSSNSRWSGRHWGCRS